MNTIRPGLALKAGLLTRRHIFPGYGLGETRASPRFQRSTTYSRNEANPSLFFRIFYADRLNEQWENCFPQERSIRGPPRECGIILAIALLGEKAAHPSRKARVGISVKKLLPGINYVPSDGN